MQCLSPTTAASPCNVYFSDLLICFNTISRFHFDKAFLWAQFLLKQKSLFKSQASYNITLNSTPAFKFKQKGLLGTNVALVALFLYFRFLVLGNKMLCLPYNHIYKGRNSCWQWKGQGIDTFGKQLGMEIVTFPEH